MISTSSINFWGHITLTFGNIECFSLIKPNKCSHTPKNFLPKDYYEVSDDDWENLTSYNTIQKKEFLNLFNAHLIKYAYLVYLKSEADNQLFPVTSMYLRGWSSPEKNLGVGLHL